MLTKTDRAILRHIEEFGFITIHQARDVFFNHQSYGYDLARRRLNKMVANGDLYMHKDHYTSCNVYSMAPLKKVTLSNTILMNFYSRMISEGCNIITFKKERSWMDNKIRNDAFVQVEFAGYELSFFVEVQVRHARVDIDRYERLFISQEPQKELDGIFPSLIIIDDVERAIPYESDKFKITHMDFNLSNFGEIFIPSM